MAAVILLDGREVDSASEEWRAECSQRHEEAQRVAAMPNNEARRAHIATVRKNRGDLAADRLRKIAHQLMQGA